MRKCLLQKEISKSLEGSLKDYEVHGEERTGWSRLAPSLSPVSLPRAALVAEPDGNVT